MEEQARQGAAHDSMSPERSSSPVPSSLLRQSRTRAGTLHMSLPHGLQRVTQQQRKAHSVTENSTKLLTSLHPVAGFEPHNDPHPPQLPLGLSSLTYSTENLRKHSTPHGKHYACRSKSAGSSSHLGGAGREHTASIAAAWLQQQEACCCVPGKATPADHMNRSTQALGISEEAMEQIIKDPVSHLMQQPIKPHPCLPARSGTIAAARAAPSTAVAAAAPVPLSSAQDSGQSHNNPPSSMVGRPGLQVFSRNNAIQLEATAQMQLPAGRLLAAQHEHMQAWSQQQQQHWLPQALPCGRQQQQTELSGQQQQEQQHEQPQAGLACGILSPDVAPWQQQISRFLAQLTQQVAYHCVEHGRLLGALQERYAELANALFLAVSCLSQYYKTAAGAAHTTTTALAAAQASEAKLAEKLAAQQAAAEEARQALCCLQAQHEQLQQDSEQTTQQLQQLVVDLKQQLWKARQDLEQQAAAADAAAVKEAVLTSKRLAEADDEVCCLKQRLAFVQEQLAAAKEQQRLQPEVTCVAIQTDAEKLPSPEPTPPPPQQQSPVDSSGEDTETEDISEDASDIPKALDLLDYAAAGHKRSRLWLVKLLGQVTADKAVADAVADRQGVARSSFSDFIHSWGHHRYGLQHLSAQVLGDLCAGICHHAAAGLLPARWFACFCHLGPAVKPTKKQRLLGPWQLPGQTCPGPTVRGNTPGEAVGLPEAEVLLGSPAAADFWVFCACQLAYPNSVVALFPEAREALPLVRSNLVMESIKAAFRYLGDSGQAQFVAEKLEAAAVPSSAASGSTAADNSSSRPGTSSSVLGTFGYYDAWALLDLLLAEWLHQAWARVQRMHDLRREAALLQPPLQQQYQAACAAAAAAEAPQQLLRSMQDAYTVLQPLLGFAAGQQLQAAPGTGSDSTAFTRAAAGAGCACPSTSVPGVCEASELLQEGTVTDVEGAWQAYKVLLSLMQLATTGQSVETRPRPGR